ncbi:MAG TPA: hypothetical protein VF062_25275, partial [Candidatus Limnocylindrales bacterium]
MIRPSVRGESDAGRRAGLRFAVMLAVANAAMAGLVVALLYQIGALTVGRIPATYAVAVCSVAAVAAVAVDLRAMRRRGYTVGLKRQTAKRLAHSGGRPWWVTPLFWGLDTGLVWSTFRVSATSWVMLLSALLTVAPQYSGLVYGAFFG